MKKPAHFLPLTILLPGVLLATPAAAEKAIFAKCTGTGAEFWVSDFEDNTTLDTILATEGVGPSPFENATLVLTDGKAPYWDPRNRDAIHRSCGGDGKAELALFNSMQPKSGLWEARIGETELKDCPAMMHSVFPISPGRLGGEMQAPQRLQFSTPFDPEDLELTRNFEATGQGDVTWTPVSENVWEAEIVADIFDNVEAQGWVGSGLFWRLELVSPERIEHLVTVRLSLPPEVAAVMGGGKDCRALSRNAWVRTAD